MKVKANHALSEIKKNIFHHQRKIFLGKFFSIKELIKKTKIFIRIVENMTLQDGRINLMSFAWVDIPILETS